MKQNPGGTNSPWMPGELTAQLGGGETGRTTAHLSNAFDDRYYEVERLFGQHGARVVAESHTAAIDKIEEIVRHEKINCDFERLDGPGSHLFWYSRERN
jgi:hypothetical protein